MRSKSLSKLVLLLAFFVALAAGIADAPARADEFAVNEGQLRGDVPRPPVAIPGLTFAISVPHTAPTVLGDVHGMVGNRLFWGAGAQIRFPIGGVDYSNSAGTDWDLSDGGPHVGINVSVGYSLIGGDDVGPVVLKRSLQHVTDDDRRYMSYYLAKDTWNLFVVGGARLGTVSDTVLAIPVGLRFQQRSMVTPRIDGHYGETWYQVEALLFPAQGKIGMQASMLPWGPLYLYFELVPALGDPDAMAQCDGLARNCEPPYAPSLFNMEPGSTQIIVGIGGRASYGKSH